MHVAFPFCGVAAPPDKQIDDVLAGGEWLGAPGMLDVVLLDSYK
jgi:hypothetical protein